MKTSLLVIHTVKGISTTIVIFTLLALLKNIRRFIRHYNPVRKFYLMATVLFITTFFKLVLQYSRIDDLMILEATKDTIIHPFSRYIENIAMSILMFALMTRMSDYFSYEDFIVGFEQKKRIMIIMSLPPKLYLINNNKQIP